MLVEDQYANLYRCMNVICNYNYVNIYAKLIYS